MRLKIYLDNKRYIEMPRRLCRLLMKYRQSNSENESGGVIIGKRILDGGIVVVNISTPFRDDLQSRFRFSKTSKMHQEFVNRYFEESKGYVSLVGEWHSHPEKNPIASSTDKKSWMKIMLENDKLLFFVIVGTEKFRIYFLKEKKWVSISVYQEEDSE